VLATATPPWDERPPAPDTMEQGNQQPKGAPPATTDAAAKVNDYNQQAQALSSKEPNPRHPPEIKALRALADALVAMPGANDVVKKSAATIRDDADKLG